MSTSSSPLISEEAHDWLCATCQALFTPDIVQLIVGEKEEGVYYERQHLLCSELLVSAQNCTLCRCIFISGGRMIPVDATGGRRIVHGEGVFIGQYGSERIRLKFVRFGRYAGEVGGFHLCTEPVPESTFGGTVLLPQISRVKFDSVVARREKGWGSRHLSPRTIARIQEWLSGCLKEHDTCSQVHRTLSTTSNGPARLLEITGQCDAVRVMLVDQEAPPAPYLTLSHCWGQSVRCKLLTTNIEAYQTCIPWEDLTATFREALELTSSLGYSHIWIDALCIIQDVAEDWRLESAKMGSIYSKGVLNIAAAAARDGDDGLFPYSPWNFTCLIPMRIEKDEQQLILVASDQMAYVDRIRRSPLALRGWVLQERLLSPRTVHFTTDQVFWECFCHHNAEFMPDDVSRFMNVGHLSKNQILNQRKPTQNIEDNSQAESLQRTWSMVVSAYTECDLSVASDRLPAVAGLASVIAKQWGVDKPGDYLAGLWKSSLAEGLLWHSSQSRQWNCISRSWRAPSWSWARIDGPIEPRSITGRCRLSIKSASTQTIEGDRYGAAPTGAIVLQGPLCRAMLSCPKRIPTMSEQLDEWYFVLDENMLSVPGWAVEWDDWSSPDGDEGERQLYFLLCDEDCGYSYGEASKGLLLQPSGRRTGQYERVGYLTVIARDLAGMQELLALTRSDEIAHGHMGFDPDIGHIIELV